MRLMNLVLCLYIILMPRSLCVCVHLGVTFTLIFIINYYYYLVYIPKRESDPTQSWRSDQH